MSRGDAYRGHGAGGYAAEYGAGAYGGGGGGAPIGAEPRSSANGGPYASGRHAFESPRGGEGQDAYGSRGGEARDPYGSRGGIGSRGGMEARDAYGSRGGMDAYGSRGGMEARDAYGSRGGMEARDANGSRGGMEARDAYGSRGGMEARDAYGSRSGMEARDAYGSRGGMEARDVYGGMEARGAYGGTLRDSAYGEYRGADAAERAAWSHHGSFGAGGGGDSFGGGGCGAGGYRGGDSGGRAGQYDNGAARSQPWSPPPPPPPVLPAAESPGPTSEDDRNERTVFVGGLPFEATDEDLRDVFGGCGKLLNARIAMDHATGKGRGFAHIEFATAAQVEECLQKCDGVEILGKRVRIDVCRPGGGGGAPARPAGGGAAPRGAGAAGGRGGRSGSQGGSRSLAAADASRRSRSASRSHGRSGSRGKSRSRSASGSREKPRKKPRRSSLFDSTAQAPEAKPPLPPLGVPTRRGRMELVAGARVDIHGLVGAAQYNGCEGRILQGPNEKGRFEVQVEFQCEERTVSLKPDNLQPKPTCGWELAAMSLAYNATERDVSEAFATCGMVRTARLTKNQDGSSKGICIVEMAHKSGAEAALEKLQGHLVNGRALKVDWSLRARQEIEAGREKEMEDAKKPRQPPAPSACVGPTPAAAPPGAAAAPPPPGAEEGAGGQRRRRSAWDEENSGGVVYAAAPASGGGAAAAGAGAGAEPLPPEAELAALPTKELRRLLAERGVNVSACFEKADLLEQARLLAKASS